MLALLLLMAIATDEPTTSCQLLDPEAFVNVPAPVTKQQQRIALASYGDLAGLFVVEQHRIAVHVFEGTKSQGQFFLENPGFDPRAVQFALGPEDRVVAYDWHRGEVFQGGKHLGTAALPPGSHVRLVRFTPSGILWQLRRSVPKLQGWSPAPTPGKSGSQELPRPPVEDKTLWLSTDSDGKNPKELGAGDAQGTGDRPSEGSREAVDVVEDSGGRRWLVDEGSGVVELYRLGAGVVQRWENPAKFTMVYELPEAQAQIQEQANAIRERLQRQAIERYGDATKPPVPFEVKLARIRLETSPYTARGASHGRLLLVAGMAAKPPRAVLVFEQGQEKPVCWQVPETLQGQNVGLLAPGLAAVNSYGLWLASPLGYFPWEAFSEAPEASPTAPPGEASKP
jgi:hypothetical protein